MAKRKPQSEPTDDLLSQKAPMPKAEKPKAVPPAIPKDFPSILEYRPLASTEDWRVAKFTDLTAEFPFPINGRLPMLMMEFHELGLQNPRPWLICRKLYGIGPMILPANSDPADFEPKTRAEVCTLLGIEPKKLQAELDALRAIWQQTVDREIADKQATEPEPLPAAPSGDLEFGEEALNEFGFDRGMFEVRTFNSVTGEEEPRKDELNRIERNWFCRRVQQWSKLLSDTHAGGLARACLMNELYLKRFESAMTRLDPASKKWEPLQKSRQDMEKTYQKQLADLQSKFPETDTTGKENYRRILSDLSRAYREYYATGDHALIDMVMTADEIEVMLRASVQRPNPQYRFGLNMAIVLAKNGLNDPNWRPYVKPAVLAKMDKGFTAAVMHMREEMAEPLPDLEKGVMPEDTDYEGYEDLQELPALAK